MLKEYLVVKVGELLAELRGAFTGLKAKPRTEIRRRIHGRVMRIRTHEPRSSIVVNEPREILTLISIREIGYKAIFLVPILCNSE